MGWRPAAAAGKTFRPAPTARAQGYVDGPEDQRLRLVERTIDFGDDGHYLVAVAGNAAEIADETRSFDQALIITFALLAAVLLLTTMFQVRFGLAPLKRITDSLAAIRSGTAERLTGEFPEEIAPLARETNALIEANKEIVERARTHVGNLAHALKTPLSVMVNEASAHRGDPFAGKVLEQADIMRDQVARHLERARLAARHTVVGSVTDVRRSSRRWRAPWRRSIASAASPSKCTPTMRRASAASGRISRRWSAIWSTMPANGRRRAWRSR